MNANLGFAHFLANADPVGQGILAILVLMSVGCWSVILAKGVGRLLQNRASRAFLQRFWAAEEVAGLSAETPVEPQGRVLAAGLAACTQLRRTGSRGLVALGSPDEFLLRALRQGVAEERARAEAGLTLLASVGAAAPFVGLFGTVWGIYHALLSIGASGQSSLDQVAGPVGEALIMTAVGLAVAIPAVLAYNAFSRANRLLLGKLDGFAHDVFALLATGSCSDRSAAPRIASLSREVA